MYFDRNATMSGAKRRGSAGMDRRPNAAWVSPQAVRADAARRLAVRAFRGPVGRDAGRRPPPGELTGAPLSRAIGAVGGTQFRGPPGRDAGRRPALRCRAPSARSAVRSFATLRAAMPVGDRRSAVARHRRGRRYAVSRPSGPRCRSEYRRSAVARHRRSRRYAVSRPPAAMPVWMETGVPSLWTAVPG